MAFSELLGSLTAQEFAEQYLFKLPYAAPHGCKPWCNFGWDAIEQIWSQPGIDALIVRRGERAAADPLPGFAVARTMFADGYTLAVRNAERHDARLQRLAEDFGESFLARVDVHIYCTPGSQFGFSWHYDAEEVFILQVSGSKEYSLRKNTVHPWPLVETMGPDLGYQHEIMPLMKCRLEAGDWLYIPSGYWHRGESSEDSISLAVGVMAAPALDLFDVVRARLLRSLRWRQRLPVLGAAGGLSDEAAALEYQRLVAELAADLQQELTSAAFLADYFAEKGRPASIAAPAVENGLSATKQPLRCVAQEATSRSILSK